MSLVQFVSTSFSSNIVLFVCLTFPVIIGAQANNSRQIITFYQGMSCNGTVLGSYTNSTNFGSPIPNAASYTVNGLWRLNYCGGSSCSEIYTSSHACMNISRTGSSVNVIQIEKFGHDYQNASEIVLYTNGYFNGTKTILSEMGKNLTNTIVVKSWHFTGNHKWSLYQSTNQTGNYSCLSPDYSTVTAGYGIKYELDIKQALVVGSIKYGCSTIIPATSTTTTIRPTIGPSLSTNRTTTTRKPSGSPGIHTNAYWKFMSIFIMMLIYI